MTMFNDKEFVSLVSSSWTAGNTSKYFVHPKDVETIVAAIRHNLMKVGSSRNSEEFVLRNIFREFDTDKSGALSINELRNIMHKINLACDDRYLVALLETFDTNKNGVIEFEEFQRVIVGDTYTRH